MSLNELAGIREKVRGAMGLREGGSVPPTAEPGIRAQVLD